MRELLSRFKLTAPEAPNGEEGWETRPEDVGDPLPDVVDQTLIDDFFK